MSDRAKRLNLPDRSRRVRRALKARVRQAGKRAAHSERAHPLNDIIHVFERAQDLGLSLGTDGAAVYATPLAGEVYLSDIDRDALNEMIRPHARAVVAAILKVNSQ